MKFASSLTLFAACTLFASTASAQAGNAAGEVLNNESITQMVVGKVPKDIILTKIRTTKNAFDLSPTGLVGLHANKVGDDVVKVMMQSGPAGAAKESLNNDAVIQMVNGLVSKEIIIVKVQASRADYDLSTNGIIKLNQNKVSQDVLKAMMAASSGSAAPPKKP